MMRKGRTYARSYSHVAIISENGKYIHATSPTSLTIKSKAVIQEDDLGSIDNLQRCFVVRSPTPGYAPKYLQRAKECLGIQFDYVASTANCETFCHGVHGRWDSSFQSPTGRGQQVVNGFSKCSKWMKSLSEPLTDQMRKRISDASLILPNEKL